MTSELPAFSTGLPNLDKVLENLVSGDNVVWRVDSIDDYHPFVTPFCDCTIKQKRTLVYFRFAQHRQLVPDDGGAIIYRINAEDGFENFISSIFTAIEKHGRGVCYVFDCLSELAVDWYSDRMLGNFFMLTCPYLYRMDTIAYFALLRNYHSSFAQESIHQTAQVVLDVYRNKEKLYLHPLKVYDRHSPTMYMLHAWEQERFLPVMRSATVTEILARVPQPWLDFTIQRIGMWQNTFMQAKEALDDVRSGKLPGQELDYHFQRIARMAITRDMKLMRLVERYLDLEDLIAIRKRMIGTGLIGGKSIGMLLARAILRKKGSGWQGRLEEHDSFYVGSDVFYTYLVENECWWVRRNQRSVDTLLDGAETARQRMLSGHFPNYIRTQFMEMLDYFGQSPIIVRSSSLLEDNYGNAFSGKYQSVFCANQGSPTERLETFISAVRKVYASTMSKEALMYRAHRGLLGADEQMALLVQRVSGAMYDDLFFPQVAGVGFSFNPYVWNHEIDPKAGMLRLVFGLGTRAVDRCDDDYTRVVALNAPNKRPESTFDDVRKFAQRRVDVLDLRANQLTSRYFEDVVKSAPDMSLSLIADRDEELERRVAEQNGRPVFSWVLTFNKLFSETDFVKTMRDMLRTLQEAYECPVDVEFTGNFLDDGSYRINLVQCRPFQVQHDDGALAFMETPASAQVILETHGPIIGNSLKGAIGRIIYVVPSVYGALSIPDRYAVARLIGKLTHLNKSNTPRIMLIGPGRWGTTTPSLGVPVSFAEINTVSVICELATMHDGLIPDISLGTHFFNDLVEFNMLYLAAYPHRKDGSVFNEQLILTQPNSLLSLVPEATAWSETVKVIDPPSPTAIILSVDSLAQKAVCYITPPLP
ncbi:MAG: PEP/pyruvate-binding domain-containing protein [Chitinispirillaceae bacterium]|nr:PEP/pyruvate-binding domain-containing protein [Chitinispirillaceae bacterium]